MSTYQTEHSLQNMSGYQYPVTTGYDSHEIENLVNKYVGRAAAQYQQQQQQAILPQQIQQSTTSSGGGGGTR